VPVLDDPQRLAAVRATGLLARERDEVLDRLTRIATALLHVPVAAVSLVTDTEHHFVSSTGMGPDLTAAGRLPLEYSLCRHTVERGAVLAIPDTRHDAAVSGNPAIARYSVAAYAGHPITDPAGQVVGAFEVVDIQPHGWTPADLAALDDLAHAAGAQIALRMTSRQLAIERAFLKGVLDSVDDPVMASDAEGRLTVVNRAAIEAGIASASPQADGPDLRILDADGRTPLGPASTPMARVLAGEQLHDVEIVSRATGQDRRYAARGRPIVAPDGHRLGAAVALRDVTAAHQREILRAALHAVSSSLAEARTAADAVQAAIAALAGALGWAVAEYWHADEDDQSMARVAVWQQPGRDLASFVEAPVERLPRGTGLVGRVWDVRRGMWLPDVTVPGSPFLRVDAAEAAGLRTAVALPVMGGGRLLGVITLLREEPFAAGPDVVETLEAMCAQVGEYLLLATERERLLHHQEQQVAALGEVSRMKSELVAVVSHELRNPIAVVRAYAELLIDDDDLDAEQRHFAEIIDSASRRMMHIVTDLLTLAETDRAPLELQQRTLALEVLLRQAVDEQRLAAADKQLQLTEDHASTLPVHGDPDRLRQAIDNLLINAIKYTPTGGTVAVHGDIEDGEVVVRISDTGIGIPPEQLPQLFTRFFRASTARKAGIRGTGLGLTISKTIIDAHGGTITAGPHEPAGTEFTVRLPLVQP
jgi:signal transduction histidine kinase/PAS domain-containing protein